MPDSLAVGGTCGAALGSLTRSRSPGPFPPLALSATSNCLSKSDSASGKHVRDVATHEEGLTDVLFSPDGKHLVTSGRDTCVRICQVADCKEGAVLGSPRGGQFKDTFNAVALSPDDRFVAATDIAGLVPVWELPG